eukprot:CAMPEP_0185504910 /NCGR_PEP_ID=MMETSP1366-20130426/35481_1 /TAXON_ID=38817 /ORGANISM="Gephyrocapsa oceanica, Strain RCC1303" /LENGTH=74 /DNA_ID=CAMNT_0028114917 /DNA_START=178 /DNA_END=402 /DNA_ORIENTATION=+
MTASSRSIASITSSLLSRRSTASCQTSSSLAVVASSRLVAVMKSWRVGSFGAGQALSLKGRERRFAGEGEHSEE